jgi:hypothetical protein
VAVGLASAAAATACVARAARSAGCGWADCAGFLLALPCFAACFGTGVLRGVVLAARSRTSR